MAGDTPTYSGWRKSLRDTLTWYVGTLTGLAAALAGGLSLGILPKLSGAAREEATIYGIGVLFLILAGAALVLRAQSQRPFPISRLRKPVVQDRLKPYLDSLLPPNILTVDGLLNTLAEDRKLVTAGKITDSDGVTIRLSRDDVAAQIAAEAPVARRSAEAKTTAGTPVPKPIDGTRGITVPLNDDQRKALVAVRRRMTDFAAGQDLAHTIRFVNVMLLIIFLVILVGLLRVNDIIAANEKTPPTAVFVDPSTVGLDDTMAAILAACADDGGPFKASGAAHAALENWWTIAPDGICAGHRLTVPEAALRPLP